MQRFQIYLDPTDAKGLEDLSTRLQLTRSQIIRELVSRLIRDYQKILQHTSFIDPETDPILKMSGIGKSKTGNDAALVNTIYQLHKPI